MQRLFSVHNRYMAAIGGLALLAVLLVGGAFAITESQQLALRADLKATADLINVDTSFSDAIRDEQSSLDDYLLSSAPSSLQAYRQAVADEARLGQTLLDGTVDAPDLTFGIKTILRESSDWRSDFAEPAVVALQAGGGARLDPFTKGAPNDHEVVQSALEELTTALVSRQTDNGAQIESVAAARTIVTALGLLVMLAASGLAILLIRRYRHDLVRDAFRAGILNRFTEVASFAQDDASVAGSNLEALGLLVRPDAGVTHVLNRSQDRAVPEAVIGSATGEVLQLSALSRCAGLVRGSMYVTTDAAAPLSVHCPVYPVTMGTLACIPLTSGETVGTVHLYWDRPDAFPLESRASVMRVVEHAALAIGNRRLLAVLEGQANTDPRTGLANSRAFDLAVEAALSERQPDETVGILMLDLDHFKDFNDRHGHPAGDEALRAFAGVLRSCMREHDIAARYGGEEFAVLLSGLDSDATQAVAERIRSRTETTLISLAPGLTDRLTVSIGVSAAPAQGVERVALLRIADEALYRAKARGRNQVGYSPDESAAGPAHGAGGPVDVAPRRGPASRRGAASA